MRLFAYVDGGCSGNPGPGGWGVVLEAVRDGEVLKSRELSGGQLGATNNRMELTAAIVALESLDRPSEIAVVTDSAYVKNGISQWIRDWKRDGWKTADGKPVKNADLWRRLDRAQSRHRVTWDWVKGHAGHSQNERADKLAAAEIKALKRKARKKDDPGEKG